MVQLDAYGYFYQPATFSQGNDGEPPQLIVLCTWMSAKSAQIIHYINGYQALCPHASILLIRSNPLDFVYREPGSSALSPLSRPHDRPTPPLHSVLGPGSSSTSSQTVDLSRLSLCLAATTELPVRRSFYAPQSSTPALAAILSTWHFGY